MLMLAAMLHLSVATHYCGGKETAMKISLTGKLADCGMESSEKEQLPPAGTNIASHCCDDAITSCVVDGNYTPAFSFFPQYYQFDFQVLSTPANLSVDTYADQILSYTNVSPPGVLMSTNVDLSGICVFRI